MPKIEKYQGQAVINAKTRVNESDPKIYNSRWWAVKNKSELAQSLFGVIKYLKQKQAYRQHQSALYCRLYGNMPIWNYMGINMTKMNPAYRFPSERPTMNIVQSCIDALVSRMVQSKPKPMFLTSGGDYKARKLAKDLNKFIDGEFYQCKAYELGEDVLRDGAILGDGWLKVYETTDNKVGVERRLTTELFVDEADGMYRYPQSFYELKILDRDVVAEMFPDKKAAVIQAQGAYFDSSAESRDTITSQIMVCEAWHLKSGANATDGRHIIAIDTDVCLDERYDDEDFPFVRFPYSPRPLGYYAQGLAEQLMGTQNEINRLLYVIQRSLHLCGIPKWLVEDGSKIVSAHINNEIGGIIKFQGVEPKLAAFTVLPPELYAQLERLVGYAYQQSGISMMSAASQKPAGLNSGTALREYDDLQTDRFAFLSQRYEKFYLDLANKIFNQAQKIAKREGKYETIYPGKNSIFKINLPDIDPKKDPFIIQNYPASALSKNPAQRKQEIVDDMQAGLIDPEEGRRLLDYPDLQQVNELLRAPEDRVLKVLDEIVEEGKYTPPDPFMPIQKAQQLVVQYYNKYVEENLEQEKVEMLLTFKTQLDALTQAAMPPAQPGVNPQAPPVPMQPNPMVPNVPQAA